MTGATAKVPPIFIIGGHFRPRFQACRSLRLTKPAKNGYN